MGCIGACRLEVDQTAPARAALLLPPAIATNLAGIRLARVTPVKLFYRIAYWLVLVISVALVVLGAAALLRG